VWSLLLARQLSPIVAVLQLPVNSGRVGKLVGGHRGELCRVKNTILNNQSRQRRSGPLNTKGDGIMRLFLCEVFEADEKPNTEVVAAESHRAAIEVLRRELDLPSVGSCRATVRELTLAGEAGSYSRGVPKEYELKWNEAILLNGGREPADLSREEACAVLQSIIDEMYHEGPDTAWDAGTIEEVARVLDEHQLIPSA
jgi:hypothetical protein